MGYMYDGLYGIDGLYVGLCGRTRRRLRGSRTFNTTQLSFTDIISHSGEFIYVNFSQNYSKLIHQSTINGIRLTP